MTDSLILPSVCPQCRSTAVDDGVVQARCWMCGWKGKREELLVVASEGLSLEETLDAFAKDLVHVVSANLSDPLRRFLLRWEIIEEGSAPAVIQYFVAGSVEDVVGRVLYFLTKVAEAAEKARQDASGSIGTGFDVDEFTGGKSER